MYISFVFQKLVWNGKIIRNSNFWDHGHELTQPATIRCFVGKRKLEQAIAARPDNSYEIKWRPYFLRGPNIPREGIQKAPNTPENPRVGLRMKQGGAAVGIDFTGTYQNVTVMLLVTVWINNGCMVCRCLRQGSQFHLRTLSAGLCFRCFRTTDSKCIARTNLSWVFYRWSLPRYWQPCRDG
jgi:hypothetical protein